MAMYGYLVFFTTVKPKDPRERLLKLLELTRVDHVFAAWRTLREERGWDFIQRNLRAVGDEVFTQPNKDIKVRDLSLREVADLFEEQLYLRIDVGPKEGGFGSRVSRAIQDGLLPDMRRDFNPGAMYIGAGYHDLTECTEEDEDRYVARAFFSVEFFGYGVPRRWREAQRLIFELPEIIAIKRELEEILGPLECFAHWSV